MEIGKTGWKTISEENKSNGGFVLGYEAHASENLLRELQANNIWIEVVDKNSTRAPRLIQPSNKDPQKFSSDTRFHIISQNKTYSAFEKMLAQKYGAPLPENRFDEFTDWTNPKAWHQLITKGNKSYYLDLTALSDAKKLELKDNLRHSLSPEGMKIDKDKLSVIDPEWVSTLEFLWKTVAYQKKAEQGNAQQPLTLDKPKKSLKQSLLNVSSQKKATSQASLLLKQKNAQTQGGK